MPAPSSACSVLGLLAVAVAVTGCGTKTVKTAQIQDVIAKNFKALGNPLHDLSCEEGVEAKAGAPISCTGLNNKGTKLIIKGTVTSVSGNDARFDAKAVGAIAQGKAIADSALEVLEKQVGQKAKGMTCPDEVPIPTQPTVTCELTAPDGKVYDAVVTLDAKANLNVKVAPSPKQ